MASTFTIEDIQQNVWVRLKPSLVDAGGVGVFAIRHIPKGTDIGGIPHGGVAYFSEAELASLDVGVQELLFDFFPIKDDRMRATWPVQFYLWNYVNHSTTPNCDGLLTLRDVSAGEELTYNYAESMPEGYEIKNLREQNV